MELINLIDLLCNIIIVQVLNYYLIIIMLYVFNFIIIKNLYKK